jgi:hypothetical protein
MDTAILAVAPVAVKEFGPDHEKLLGKIVEEEVAVKFTALPSQTGELLFAVTVYAGG